MMFCLVGVYHSLCQLCLFFSKEMECSIAKGIPTHVASIHQPARHDYISLTARHGKMPDSNKIEFKFKSVEEEEEGHRHRLDVPQKTPPNQPVNPLAQHIPPPPPTQPPATPSATSSSSCCCFLSLSSSFPTWPSTPTLDVSTPQPDPHPRIDSNN